MCLARAAAAYGPWRLRGPDSDAQREGRRLHAVVQAYLRDGTQPSPLERAAHAAIGVIPARAGSVPPEDIERVVLLPKHFGYIDFELPTAVGDLKFTSNTRYQREVDPTRDPQRIVYANDRFYRDPYAVEVRQIWVVSQFNGHSSVALEHTWTRRAAKRALQQYVEPAASTLDDFLASGKHWNDAPKNLGACSKYPPHGCHLRQSCTKPKKEAISFPKPKV